MDLEKNKVVGMHFVQILVFLITIYLGYVLWFAIRVMSASQVIRELHFVTNGKENFEKQFLKCTHTILNLISFFSIFWAIVTKGAAVTWRKKAWWEMFGAW